MNAVIEAPTRATEKQAHRTAAAQPRTTWRSRWRIAARLAQRQVRRTAASSWLIAVLVALPIAALSGYVVVGLSLDPTPAEEAAVELGETEAWLRPVGVPDAGMWQIPDQPGWNGYPIDAGTGSYEVPEGEPISDPAAVLPPGTETIRLVSASSRLVTEGASVPAGVWVGRSWDERFAGRFDLIEGSAPSAPDEALATPATLERLRIAVGDEITLADDGGRYTVVGTMRNAAVPADQPYVFLPDAAPVVGETTWYLPETRLSWTEVADLNAHGVIVYSREVVLNPPAVFDPSAMKQAAQNDYLGQLLLVTGAGALIGAYVVVMLAGAAFAVAARRQQRSLAVAASVGATAADLRRVILLQGSFLGLVGGVIGILLGIGGAALVMRLTDDGSSTRYWGFHVPWLVLGGILVFAALVGTASAAMPARTVARSDTLAALRGARRPQRIKASRPIWGTVIMLLGLAFTALAAITVVTVQAVDGEVIAYDSPLRSLPPLGLVVGPIVAQLGILLSGGWLLLLTSRALSRLGLAARLASRDAAAHSSRTVPAFAAIAATVFIAVFALGQTGMQRQDQVRSWRYAAPIGDLRVDMYPAAGGALTSEQATDGGQRARDVATALGATELGTVAKQVDPNIIGWTADGRPAEIPDDMVFSMAVLPEEHLLDPHSRTLFRYPSENPQDPIAVIDADDLSTVLGVDLSPAQLAAYRDGTVITADPRWVTDGSVRIGTWTAQQFIDGAIPDNVWMRGKGSPAIATPVQERKVDAITVDLPDQPVAIAVSPETAVEFGIDAQPSFVIASFELPPTQEVRDRAQLEADGTGTTDITISAYFEDGPPSGGFWMIPILAVVAVLVLGASTIALGLARFERRPDDATLSAVGGTRGLRRRVSFWQGLIIAGFGTVVGAAAGVLVPIGFAIQSGGALWIADIPWFTLSVLVIGLPLAIAIVSWVVPPRVPDLTRRTVIA